MSCIFQEFDTIARLETSSIDAYNDAHHYRLIAACNCYQLLDNMEEVKNP